MKRLLETHQRFVAASFIHDDTNTHLAGVICTIMSTTMPVAAMARKTREQQPG
jgi:hypothetical protein